MIIVNNLYYLFLLGYAIIRRAVLLYYFLLLQTFRWVQLYNNLFINKKSIQIGLKFMGIDSYIVDFTPVVGW